MNVDTLKRGISLKNLSCLTLATPKMVWIYTVIQYNICSVKTSAESKTSVSWRIACVNMANNAEISIEELDSEGILPLLHTGKDFPNNVKYLKTCWCRFPHFKTKTQQMTLNFDQQPDFWPQLYCSPVVDLI